MTKEKNNEQNFAIVLLLMILALISLATIHSATGGWHYVIMQGAWYLVGAVIVFIVMQFDSEQLWKLAPVAYGIGIILLIAVLIVGVEINGSTRWINLGFMNFQTSEVMKIAFILTLARLLTSHNRKVMNRTIKSDCWLLAKIVLLSLPPIGLIMLQSDLGTTIVFIAIIAGMTLLSGVSWKILGPLIGIVSSILIGMFCLILFNREILYKIGFHSYQFDRVDVWLDPYLDVSGDSYQSIQSMKAIGSGQLGGTGFGMSEVYVPENHTDFIFTVLGENFGFIGSAILLFVYFLLIYRFVLTCFKIRNEFYSYIVTGVIMLVSFHIFENIGMTIGLLPVTGIPLPFISYGGSSLLGNMIAVGLVLSMNHHNHDYIFSEKDKNFE